LKASEYIHLPLQAADDWLRVRRHLLSGDIARYGYFPRVELQQAPPLVYLVGPALRFHPATDELLRYLLPGLEIVRVGLAESWRRGLRVVMRQQFLPAAPCSSIKSSRNFQVQMRPCEVPESTQREMI
jgi:hypothetical protein